MERNFFSKNLYAYKCAYRLENTDLAQRLNSTPQTIGRWLKEKRAPPRTSISAVAEKMGVTPDDALSKDLSMYFLTRSGFLDPGELNHAAEGEAFYGKSIGAVHLLKHLKQMQERLKAVIDDNEKEISAIES